MPMASIMYNKAGKEKRVLLEDKWSSKLTYCPRRTKQSFPTISMANGWSSIMSKDRSYPLKGEGSKLVMLPFSYIHVSFLSCKVNSCKYAYNKTKQIERERKKLARRIKSIFRLHQCLLDYIKTNFPQSKGREHS